MKEENHILLEYRQQMSKFLAGTWYILPGDQRVSNVCAKIIERGLF